MDHPEPRSTGGREITDLLLQLRDDRPGAMNRLFPLIYDHLRRIAHRQLQTERSGHTLGTSLPRPVKLHASPTHELVKSVVGGTLAGTWTRTDCVRSLVAPSLSVTVKLTGYVFAVP